MFRGAIGSQEGITINIEVVTWRDLRMVILGAEQCYPNEVSVRCVEMCLNG